MFAANVMNDIGNSDDNDNDDNHDNDNNDDDCGGCCCSASLCSTSMADMLRAAAQSHSVCNNWVDDCSSSFASLGIEVTTDCFLDIDSKI